VIATAVMVAVVDGRIVEGVPSVDGLKTAWMTDACTHLDQVQITQLPESGEGSTTWKES